MNFRLIGWSSLFVLLLFAACGPPEVHDINGGSSVGGDDDDGGGDDDDAATTLPTATTPPGGAPTLTNVPSFATWDSTVRPLGCATCHTGGSGGFYMNPGDQANKKYFWFSAICNRATGNTGAGTQDYQPATGRLRNYYCGQAAPDGNTHSEAGIGNACTTIENWMAQGAASTPPSCNDYYDLSQSS